MPEDLDHLRLSTQRLRLRAPEEHDVDFVLDMYSRPQVTRYLGTREWVETTEEQALRRIHSYRAHFAETTGVWLIETRHDDAPAGFMLLKPIPFSAGIDAVQQEVEIGWHLHPDALGRGYATEAGAALVARARDAGIRQLVAVTHAGNAASRSVAQRLGMQHQGPTGRYYGTICELFTLML